MSYKLGKIQTKNRQYKVKQTDKPILLEMSRDSTLYYKSVLYIFAQDILYWMPINLKIIHGITTAIYLQNDLKKIAMHHCL